MQNTLRCDNFFKASETFLIIKVQEKVLNKQNIEYFENAWKHVQIQINKTSTHILSTTWTQSSRKFENRYKVNTEKLEILYKVFTK